MRQYLRALNISLINPVKPCMDVRVLTYPNCHPYAIQRVGSCYLEVSFGTTGVDTIVVDLLINLPVKKVITPDSEEGAVNLLTIY